MEKTIFNYSGLNQSGNAMSGSLNATDAEDAARIARNLGIKNPKITNPIGGTEPIGDPVRRVVGDPISSKPPEVIMPPKPTYAPIEPPEKPDSVPTMNEKNAKQAGKVMTAMRGLGNDVTNFNESRQPSFVRQSLLIGEEKRILEQIEPLLAKQDGRIVSVNMVPNHHGNIIFAVVVEHESREKK